MTRFLVLASTYEVVNMALFEGVRMLATDILAKQAASKEILTRIEALLSQQGIPFNDLDFCAVNQGPGPFTTLRTVIATANGLSFATKIPLIGVNELESLLQEYKDNQYPHTIVLLNAFNFDVYYSLWESPDRILSDCMNIDLLLQKIKTLYPAQQVRFIGNGAELYRQKIIDLFDSDALIPDPLPVASSIEQIARLALHTWHTEPTHSMQLQPIYLKHFRSVS